tara:strand:+ start:217 stop:480 length:264 start_codon:yes stop_codon:yes gene_type:complete
MKLIYTSIKNTSKPKNKLYFNNFYFKKTNKNFTKKKEFSIKNNKSISKHLANRSIALNFTNKKNTRRSMRMFVPFSKTRKCGGCFRH